MIQVYNKLEQARNILRELRRTHLGVSLPGGSYALAGRQLENVCKFLEHELEGAMRDCNVDPSGGATKSPGAPDNNIQNSES